MKRLLRLAVVLALLVHALAGLRLAQAQEKVLVVALTQEPDRLWFSRLFASTLVANALFDGLVEFDDQMQVFPALAREVPTIENGGVRFIGEGMDQALQVTFKLRQGIVWSDGQPFTSEDVKATYELIMNPLAGFDNSLEAKIDRVETPDPHTVVITYLSASAARQRDPSSYADQTGPVVDPQYLLGINTDNNQFIYPAHILRSVVGDDLRTSDRVTLLDRSNFIRQPVGTGPYVVELWEPGIQIVLRARPDSFHGTPSLNRVIFRVFPSTNAALMALESGEADVVTQETLDVSDAARLDALPGVRAFYTPGTAWEHLTFNLDNPILADKNVRQAIAYGLNREELNQVLLYGKGEVAHSQLPRWSWAYNPNVFRYEYDPARAQALLELAGWTRGPDGIRIKDGQRLSLKYWSTGSASRPGTMPLIKAQLAQIGVELTIELIPAHVFFDPMASSPQAITARQFDIVEFSWIGGFDPGADLKFINHSVNVPAPQNNFRGGNLAGFRHDRTDLLLDQARSVVDQQLRAYLYHDVQSILSEELPVIPLFSRPATAAVRKTVLNFRPSMASNGETWNIHEWDIVS